MSDLPRLQRATKAAKIGIVHLGPGAFFRAFNAVYTEEAMQAAGGDWGILAVSVTSANARDQLAPQDCAYSSVTLGQDGGSVQVISAISKVLVAPEDPETVVRAMADPNVRIVSLTVTEKGYCHEPSTGQLQTDHPDIQHDIAHLARPRSAPGLIVAALAVRKQQGVGAFTVLSCDNLPGNGTVTRNVITQFARLVDAELADWIADQVSFPSTMVDRITPATTQADIDALGEQAGYFDPAAVVHEGFRQWVIEDDFVAGRPAWDAAGAQFVASVEAHEAMKLRCLNGTHSTLAYLGYLAGYETISEAVADPDFACLCEWLWTHEIVPTLDPPEGEDLAAYCRSLLARYRDPSIRHRTWQIAMDGSQKLPQRILGTIQDNLAAGRSIKGLSLAVAGWMRYVGGVDEKGASIDVRDPMADQLKTAFDAGQSTSEKVANLLAFDDIFDPRLAANATFRAHVTDAFEHLQANGAARTVRAFVESL